MKTRFHVFFLFSLIFTLAVAANAGQVALLTDSETGGKYINMPVTDYDTLVLDAATSFKVFDDGGEYGLYSDDAKGYLVIAVPSGFATVVSGTVNTESCCDYLKIYKNEVPEDGEDEEGYLLLDRTSGENVDVSLISAEQKTIFYFYSDGSVERSGLELNVSVGNPSISHSVLLNTATGGSVASNKTEATFGEEITLTLTPSENNLIKGVSVVDGNGNVVKTSEINWYSGTNTAKFIMPGSDVTVTPEFVGSISAAGGDFVNMPVAGTKVVTIPAGVTSFKVYDDGGKNGDYSNDVDGYLVLTAPEGHKLQIAGKVRTESSSDYLDVYNGDMNNREHAAEWNGEINDAYILSTGNSMVLRFHSDDGWTNSGLDLVVTVVDLSTPHTVTLTQVDGGTVASDKATATFGEEVTLTLTPSENKFIGSVSVVDENGNAVSVPEIKWYSDDKTVTFTMPASGVSVTPSFVNNITAEGGAYINMPYDETTEISIPAGVMSFNVYDDGGQNGNYSYGAYGYLVLTAPENYTFLVTGSVHTESCCDALSIYEGSGADEDNLLLDELSGNSNLGSVASNGRVITLYFHSDGSEEYSGLNLKVSLVDYSISHNIVVANVSGGTVTSDKTTALLGETVELDVDLNANTWLNRIDVADENGSAISVQGGTWYTSSAATFTMPYSDVTVTPDYATTPSAAGGLYVNMPANGSEQITIPSGVSSFKLYDDGGRDGNYTGASGWLELIAPEGKVLQVTGYGQMYDNGKDGDGYLTIYNGDDSGERLLDRWYRSTWTAIDPVQSIGNVVTIEFEANYGTAAGFELTVSVLDAPPPLTITYLPTTGGTLTGPTSAQYRETVEMDVSTETGYLLSRVDVVGTDDNSPVEVNGGHWYSGNEVSFVMPNKDVSVTARFTDNLTVAGGLYVVMPTDNSRLKVFVPNGVSSFKIYRDNFNDYWGRGWIELQAPDGYVLQVSGLTDDLSGILSIEENGEYGDYCAWGYCGTDKETIVSQYSQIKLRYESDDPNDDLDLTVTLIDATTSHSVRIAENIVGGTIESDPTSATVREWIHLTATPNDGYLLSSVDVTDSLGNSVEVENGKWYSENQAGFYMPAMYVTVSPTFTNDFTGLSVNMPVWNDLNVVVPAGVTSFKVYDDGGADGEYTKEGGTGYLVMTAPEGYVFRVSGTVSTGSDNDYLRIIDGDKSGEILLNSLSGYEKDVGTYYSTGRVMTLMFTTSYSGSPMDGLDLTVELVDASIEHAIALTYNSLRGTVSSDKSTAATGETVTLTAVPRSDYLLKEIRVTDANGNSKKVTGGTWATSNTATFTMPYSDVSAEAIFTDNWTSSVLFVNMPASGDMTVDIPEGVSSFKVYDDGGINASSVLNADGHLVLRAPIGYRLQALGSITGRYMAIARLSIHDGDASASVISEVNSEYMGGTKNVATVTSSGNVMTLDFSCNPMMGKDFGNPADMQLVVTLVAAEAHEVALGEYTGGTASIDKTTAYPGETVTLTTHSATGYVLAGVSVVNSESNPVKTSATSWNADNTVTFVMPNDGVTVTPQFTNNLTAEGGLYIRMPSGGNAMQFTVPEGVTSFKLYAADVDEYHCTSDYSDNIIELASADGKGFLIEGSISSNSNLRIYDGQMEWEQYPPQDRYYWGYQSTDIGQYQSTGDMVTIAYDRCEDLDLTVTVGGVATKYTVTVADAVGGTVSSSKDEALAGQTVNLEIRHDATHILEGIRVEDTDGNSVVELGATWYNYGNPSFTMPSTNVTVIPAFTDKLTAEDGLFINMPSNEWNDLYASIPGNVKSFKIYDDGGSDGNYTTPANGEITMYAPSGYAFKLTGSMTASADGRLSIEVGNNGDYSTQEIASAGEGLATDIGTITGDYMELDFRGCYNDKECNSAQTYSGLDLTVTLVKTTHYVYGAISVDENATGEMVATVNGMYNDDEEVYVPEEISVNKLVFNRKFNTSGFSTIVLPVDINGSNIDGLRQVLKFDGMGVDENGKKKVKMRAVWCQNDVNEVCSSLSGDLEAYTPYIIQLADNTLTFKGSQTLVPTKTPETRVGDWVFRGTLARHEWYDGDGEVGRVYGYAANDATGVSAGDFVRFADGAWIRPMRAYLIKEPVDRNFARGLNKNINVRAADEDLPEKIEVEIIYEREDGSEETTVIGHFNTRTGEFILNRPARTFDLKGRNVNGTPKAKGMYIRK